MNILNPIIRDCGRNMRLIGRSRMTYALTEPLYPCFGPVAKAHIWKAESSGGDQVVVNFRRLDSPQSCLNFQKEISQGQKFKDARYIRRLLDVVKDPARKDLDYGIVMEWFPGTLWEARETGRLTSFGLSGIRKIMKDVLKGIKELHAGGVIHLNIKAQNILLDRTSAKLSDLGSTWPTSPPSMGTAQPMPYRSPEILFGLQWSKEVDIWGWGMVYLHMVQAYLHPNIWGLYDSLPEESTADMTRQYEERVRCDVFHDFQLNLIPYYQKCKDNWPERDSGRGETTIRSILEYLQFPVGDIHILKRVLTPDPRARPTAKEILHYRWLDFDTPEPGKTSGELINNN